MRASIGVSAFSEALSVGGELLHHLLLSLGVATEEVPAPVPDLVVGVEHKRRLLVEPDAAVLDGDVLGAADHQLGHEIGHGDVGDLHCLCGVFAELHADGQRRNHVGSGRNLAVAFAACVFEFLRH